MNIAFSRAHLATVLWGGACIALAWVIGGFELDWGAQIHAPLPVLGNPAAKPVQPQLLPEFILLPLEQGYSETVNRSLFVVTRRSSPLPAGPKLAMQKGQFVLLGVILAQDTSIALLKELSSGKTHRVAKGTQINGITLEKVDAERVTLARGDDSEELTLKIQPMAKPAPAPAPAQASASAPGAATASAPARPGQEPGQAVPPAAQGVPAAPAAMPGAKNLNDMVNRRRALRGLPPI